MNIRKGWTLKEKIEDILDDIEDVLYRFAVWTEEHPIATVFFVQIPLSVITCLLTIKLLG